MTSDTVKKLSPVKRVAGLVFIALVGVVSAIAAFLIVRYLIGGSEPAEEATRATSEYPDLSGFEHIVLMFLGGCFFTVLGAATYVLTLGTQCFTVNFSRPFWNSIKKKLYVMHIIVSTFLILGAAGFVSMIVTPILLMAGISLVISLTIPLLGTFILLQLVLVWFNIWRPLERSAINKRLEASGISQEDYARGVYIGISDPAKSSFRKMTFIEEDVGMLWFGNQEIVYIGDSDSFRIKREQLVSIERAVDAGSVAEYFGNVSVIIRFQSENGNELARRLHPEGQWTMSSKARASNMLAEKLERWKNQPD